MPKANILIVEDEMIVAEDLSRKLDRLEYTVCGITESGEEAVTLARARQPDLVLMDIRLRGPMDGVEAAQRIRQECDIPVIYLTAHSDAATLQRAKLTEPFGYILKPFEELELESHIQMALYKHKAEQEVRHQRELLAVTLQSIGDAVITTDAEGKIASLNPVAEALTGWKMAEALGRPVQEVFHIVNEETRAPAPNPVERVFKEGVVVGLANHTALISRDGTERAIEDSAAPIKNSGGRIWGVVMVFRDVTERRRAQRVIEEHNADLERLVAERTAKLRELVGDLEQFSYTITHDMRAPLRAMQGFGQIMQEGGCAECDKGNNPVFLQRIITGAGRMDQLITDALDYAKVIRAELTLTPVDLGALLRGILDTYPNLQPPKVEICLEGQLPSVMGNEAALTQCFSNLLGNAVKFVAPGVVPKARIWAEQVRSAERGVRNEPPQSSAQAVKHQPSTINSLPPSAPSLNSQLSTPSSFIRVWVEDNGIGIPKESQSRIFEMFQRASKAHHGTGIGLALVRKNMERMGGKVGVESEPGQGSRFWLEFPKAR